MKPTKLNELLYWSYANLAMAHAALSKGAHKFGPGHYSIRAKLYKGLMNDTMRIGSLFDDTKIKLTSQTGCVYCGSTTQLSVDHIIPRFAQGSDSSDNLVLACRACNSSKNKTDLSLWCRQKEYAPSILIYRNYLKLIIRFSVENGYMEYDLSDLKDLDLPFSPDHIITSFRLDRTVISF